MVCSLKNRSFLKVIVPIALRKLRFHMKFVNSDIYKRTKTNSHGNVLKRSMNLPCNQQARSYVYLKTPGRTHLKKNYFF